MLSAGSLLDNRYRLDDRVATGGMGDVWRGTDVVLGRTVAVKVLRTAMLEDPEFAARFYGEARMMAAFRHPGVVEVYDYASDGDYEGPEKVAYLVMAFVEGEPLSARVKEGPISVTDTMSIVAQAADALHAAHENGIVHRDVKPGNLIVKPTGAVILVDFGVARSTAMTSVTGLNAIVGTALYMAPEQVAKGNLTPATDIYALGAVAYHCIAGRPPFDGDNALQVALRHLEDEPDPLPDHVPYEVRDLIARAMAKQPADRFQSAEEFAQAAFAVAGPIDWKRLTGTSLVAPVSPATRGGTTQFQNPGAYQNPGNPGNYVSGQYPAANYPSGQFPAGATRPISPAPPRPLPMQRSVPAPPVSRQSGSQRVLMFAILGLFLVAGGLGVAFAFTPDNTEQSKPPTATVPAEVPGPVVSDLPTDEVSPSAEEEEPEPEPSKSRVQSKSPSPSPKPSKTSPSPSPAASSPSPPPPSPSESPTPDPTSPSPTPPIIPPIEGGDG
ncbi:serine/threonine-protein kinase [Actinoplanes derwentensis]|uniref:non-specific serine/threonine protein kinase n=1 Tax=Actinoplanes derwentensis TaxID=113562 RepID=A0A1H2C6R9_9ACTN|nr:serine/threonine-protein kinase [Actinoplanes derwentensis]GID84241.1 putative serine/threonine-protein kinase PknA [Actinoplanes derwentensis]SDT66019.1 serine/threonine protein kinase [Actinoplanes derwentensis]